MKESLIDKGIIKSEIAELEKLIKDLEISLKPDEIRNDISELEKEATHPGFWNDQEQSQKVLKRIKFLKQKISGFDALLDEYDNICILMELYEDEADKEIGDELAKALSAIKKNYSKVKLQTMLGGRHDKENAIMSFHAGAGGTEAQDWVEMLMRMYSRWAEGRGYNFTVTDILPGDEGGVKSATVHLEGDYAYGYIKSEIGVHRLVRISPFDSSGRRHTSFASIEVIPEISNDVEINIKQEDLRTDTYRASGAGGQHVNKTDSAVRITHIPTGLVVSCQSERSQHQNRDTAMKLLYSKLFELKEREAKEKIEDLKGVQMDIAWGSQIRSYVFCPYTMVKDHRTDHETGDVQKVMDGDIDDFINAFLILKGGKDE